jgi:CRP-like cAMP-binding protein
VPVFAALPDETRKRLEQAAETREYRRRQVIFFPDNSADFVYVMCTGRIKISKVSDQGREITLFMLDSPNIFGETGLSQNDGAYGVMAETLEDSSVALFRRDPLWSAVAESPAASVEMFRLISRRRASAEAQLADMAFLDVTKRLAKLLLRLSESGSGRADRGSVLMRTKLTHQELAHMVGSTRETITMILNDFRRTGCVDFVGRRIVINDYDRLDAIARRNGDVAHK